MTEEYATRVQSYALQAIKELSAILTIDGGGDPPKNTSSSKRRSVYWADSDGRARAAL